VNAEPVAVGGAVNAVLVALLACLPLLGVPAATVAVVGAAVVAVANLVVLVVRSKVSPVALLEELAHAQDGDAPEPE
jgi:hypothetical protein